MLICFDIIYVSVCWYSLASLESLELRDNVLKTLPSSMSSLTKLRVLDLGSNFLEDLVSLLVYTLQAASCQSVSSYAQWSKTSVYPVPRHNLTFGSRAFRFFVSGVWNSLPVSICESQSLPTFRCPLKTYYVRQTLSLGCISHNGTYLRLCLTLTVMPNPTNPNRNSKVTVMLPILLTLILGTVVNGTLNPMFALFSVSLPPFSSPPCLEYLCPRALILLRLWRYINHVLSYLLIELDVVQSTWSCYVSALAISLCKAFCFGAVRLCMCASDPSVCVWSHTKSLLASDTCENFTGFPT